MVANWKDLLLDAGHRAEDRWDALRRAVKAELGWLDPVTIFPFRGYGDARRLRVRARVLESGGLEAWQPGSSTWSNLVRMLHRFESDEVPGARLRARFDGCAIETRSDSEGYVRLELGGFPELAPDPDGAGRWRAVELDLLAPLRDQDGPVRANAPVLTPPPAARFGVISDVDDTIIRTGATDLVRNWRTILLNSAESRSPFRGVAAFYRALERGPAGGPRNPIFYVSSSPWNLYDLLERFLQLHEIPLGPMLLRDFGIERDRFVVGPHDAHKISAIEELLDFYPRLPFVLIGDSGQHDAEIYRRIVREHPGRVLAVYLRDVSPNPARDREAEALLDEVRRAGVQAAFGTDLLEAAENAAAQGWITEAAVAGVAAEIERDSDA